MPEVRRLARSAGRDGEIADALWATGIHEARLLATLMYEPRALSLERCDVLLGDVISWDLCDHLCNSLFVQMPEVDALIGRWREAETLYTRRAAFSLIASAATHRRDLSSEQLGTYLDWISGASRDARPHVRKAVAWALREVGRHDLLHRDIALALASALLDSEDRTARWIGREARKELVTLVEVPGRRRLAADPGTRSQPRVTALTPEAP